MNLCMTHEEICRDYRLSANPREQIKILAERNLTTGAVIRRILDEGGVTVKPFKMPGYRKPTVWTPERVAMLEVLSGQGLSAAAIAKELGIGRSTVQKRLAEKENCSAAVGAAAEPKRKI